VEDVVVENCVLWCDWGKSIETWCGHKPTEIKNIIFRNNRLIHVNAVAMNITVWFGSDHSFVNNVIYENIYIDVDDDYCFNMIENNGTKNFVRKMGFVPKVVSVSVEMLGKMDGLGAQKCIDADDFSEFGVYFGNITYKNVRCFGSKRDLRVFVKKHSDIHTIENINAIDCDFTIERIE
jgi:hypothetical protein